MCVRACVWRELRGKTDSITYIYIHSYVCAIVFVAKPNQEEELDEQLTNNVTQLQQQEQQKQL